jgi:hypothetical protein
LKVEIVTAYRKNIQNITTGNEDSRERKTTTGLEVMENKATK